MAHVTARFLVADVFDGLATLETGSVDLVVTSPPFLALRSYLPADHPDKGKEIGSEATPAKFIDVMLKVSAELRRVLAPHGSICIELGDTYAGGGGWGKYPDLKNARRTEFDGVRGGHRGIDGWPLPKSKALIAELYRVALAYGINPLTGSESPAGRWRIRNVVTWVRPNPPVGALGDKWRPATSDLTVACTSAKRYWDDLATRKPSDYHRESLYTNKTTPPGQRPNTSQHTVNGGGAPLLDWWKIPPGGYTGSHYAVFPPELVIPCIQAMCPPKVCRTCGEPSRRIVVDVPKTVADRLRGTEESAARHSDIPGQTRRATVRTISDSRHIAWSCCGCCSSSEWDEGPNGRYLNREKCADDHWRPALILDPFAGSGTTLAVATGYGHDAIGIDIDPRNAELALQRVGPFLLEVAR